MWPPSRLLAFAFVGFLVMPPVTSALATEGGANEGVRAVAAETAGRAFTTLFMKAGAFDPVHEGLPLSQPLRGVPEAAASPQASDGQVRFILQFEGGISPDLIFHLHGRGVTFERYLPEGGMIAAAEPRNVPASAGAVGARVLLPLHPGFKMDPALWREALAPGGGALLLSILVFDTPRARELLDARGAVLAFDGRLAVLRAARSEILPLTRLGDVEWVEAYAAPAPLLNYTTRILAARQDGDGALQNDGRSVWSYDNTTDSYSGIDGRGITINIADSGIDLTHPDFAGRVVAYYDYNNDGSRCDCEGGFPHGTHVAGIAAGNGSWRAQDTNRTDGQYAGVAPGALLVAQEIFESIRTPTQYSQDAYAAGAFVNSNSWASSGGGVYTTFSQEYDDAVIDANGRDSGTPQMVYVFSAGNAGPSPYSTGAPSTGKNVISVGASGNLRSSSPDSVAGFSSRGPTSDGRIKPDLVAPGHDVISARGDINSTGCWGDDGCSYWSASGTSMSAPAVSGAAALVAAAYKDRTGILPSAAMVKALLIAGATPLPGYAYPGPDQGWGRVNLSRSINEDSAFRHLTYDEGPALSLAPGLTATDITVFVEPGQELRVVLVWSDVPGTASSSKALINDIDLEARAPDGSLFLGNALVDGFSQTNGSRDTGNNTEVVRVKAPVRGVWTFTVRASVIPSGSQRFALVMTGNITDKWVSLVPGPVTLSPSLPKEDDPMLVVVPVLNQGTLYSGPLRVQATLQGPEGSVFEEVDILQVRPGDDLPAFFWFAPRRGDHTLRVTVDPGGTSGDAIAGDNNASTTLFVRGFEIALAPIKNASAVAPLGSDTLLLQVVNRGNVADTVSVEATASSGWTITLNVTARTLEAGESRFIAGSVTAPDRALEGETGSFTVRAVSAGNSSRSGALNFSVPIASVTSSRLIQATSAAAVDPGGHSTFEYAVENTGNTPLHLNFTASFVPGPPPLNWSVTPPFQALVLAPYTRANLSLTLYAPPEALASELRTAQVTVDSVEEGTSSPLLFRVVVNRTSGFNLDLPVTTSPADPGSAVSFPVRVQNLGNSRETFSLAVAPLPGGPGGVLFDLDQATLSIAPFSQAYATVEVTVRTYAGAGNVSARVSAISQTGDTLGQTLTVSIPALHGVAVEAPARVSGRQGTSTVAVVSVENVGNVDEPVVLAVDTAPAGISVTGWSGPVVLARGEIRMLTITLSISSSAAPGLVDVALLLDSAQGGGLAPVVTALHLDVRPAETPAQSFVPGAGGFAAGVALCAAAAGAAWARKLPRRPF